MWGTRLSAIGAAALLLVRAINARAGSIEPHAVVHGTDVVMVNVRLTGKPWHRAAWDDLDRSPLEPGHYELRFQANGGDLGGSLELPHCAGRERVAIDGQDVPPQSGPLVVPISAGERDVLIGVSVSPYERRIACGDFPRFGRAVSSLEGLGILTFASPSAAKGGGLAVVYVPPGHDVRSPAALLVGLHPWNGTMWTYAAYAQLLREARAHDVVLIMPSGLGNSLYTADAEEEVMRAIAAVSDVIAINPRAVSLWGASMGGAGATTIGFHRPDRFASVTSFFGDSKYDPMTYVRPILPTDAAAHLVNALDVVDNARNLPVWLIHGDRDRTSPIRQSEMLSKAMAEKGMKVRFDRVAGMGHEGALVARFLPEMVAVAASTRVPEHVDRMTYRSVRATDTGAYGVRIVRTLPSEDATIDVERRADGVHILRADGVRAIAIARGALGTSAASPPRLVCDAESASNVDIHWEP